MKILRPSLYIPLVVGLLLAIMFSLELFSAMTESQTYDEAVHLSSGLSYWRTGDFRLNPEHPPLLKLLAALPLLLTRAQLPLHDQSWPVIDEWRFGELFLYDNVLPPQTLLLLGRLPLMILSLLLGGLMFKVSQRLFGTLGGFTTLGLYVFDPSIIAHSRYITTDLGFTCLSFIALLRLLAVTTRPTKINVFWFGLSFLAAGLSKFSGLAYLVVLLVVTAVLKLHFPSAPALRAKTVVKFLLIFLPAAWLVTWSVYAFDIRSPANDPRVTRLAEERNQLLASTPLSEMNPLQRFVVDKIGNPTKGIGILAEKFKNGSYPTYTFFRGLTAVISHATGGHGSFLLGMTGDQGWWYYFPITILAKTPLTSLVALLSGYVLVGTTFVRSKKKLKTPLKAFRSLDRNWVTFLTAPVVYLGIAMIGHLNLGWRHIMPIYPPLYVMAGVVTTIKFTRFKWPRLLLPIIFISGALVAEIGIWPNQMAFFGPLVGGPVNGPNILQDSNLDWGQDLPKLATYVKEKNITAIPFAYYGRARVQAYLPQAQPLPSSEEVLTLGRPKGYLAISIGQLYDQQKKYSWLWSEVPQERIGSSILVYYFR